MAVVAGPIRRRPFDMGKRHTKLLKLDTFRSPVATVL